jgi:aldose 1-epimerase
VHRLTLVGVDEPVEVLAGDAMVPPLPPATSLTPPASPAPPAASSRDSTRAPDDPGIFRGRLLVPFNDRIRAGRYTWRGLAHRLPVNDPDQGDAIHGFLYRTPLAAATEYEGILELKGSIAAQPGYPFPLDVHVTYCLRDSDFSLDLAVRNRGTDPAPVALGWHPYFTLPDADRASQVDSMLLGIPADRYVAVDRELIPTGSVPAVAGTEHDFRAENPVGEREIDLAWVPDAPRERPVTLSHGRYRLRLFMDGAFRLVQVYIPPDRGSIALEPVSAAADSFNRRDCLELVPGATVRARAVVALSASAARQGPARRRVSAEPRD